MFPQQDPQAASALVNANKTLPTTSQSAPPAEPSKPPEKMPSRLRNHKRTGSAGSAASTGSSFISRTASPAKFDKYGRRLLTPPNTRTNSAYSSIPGTPPRDSEVSTPNRHYHISHTSPGALTLPWQNPGVGHVLTQR
jgi:hypothetical protein